MNEHTRAVAIYAYAVVMTLVSMTRALLLFTIDWKDGTKMVYRRRSVLIFGFCVEAACFLVGLLAVI